MTNVILFWAGGKESALAFHELKKNLDYKVLSLITIFNKDRNELSEHGTPEILITNQAKFIGIPLIRTYSDQDSCEESILDTVKKFKDGFIKKNVKKLAFGDISNELLKKIQDVVGNEIEVIIPLESNLNKRIDLLISGGFRAIASAIDEEKSPLNILGKELDTKLMNTLNENNTYNSLRSFVAFGPGFKMRVPFSKNITVKVGKYTQCKLREV